MTSEEFQRLTKKLGHHLKYGTEPLTEEEQEALQTKLDEIGKEFRKKHPDPNIHYDVF